MRNRRSKNPNGLALWSVNLCLLLLPIAPLWAQETSEEPPTEETPQEPATEETTTEETSQEEPAAESTYLLNGFVDVAYRYLNILEGNDLLFRRYVFKPEGLYSPSVNISALYNNAFYWRLRFKDLMQRDLDSYVEIGHADRFRFWGLYNRAEFFSMDYFPAVGLNQWGFARSGSTRGDLEIGARRKFPLPIEQDDALNLSLLYTSKEQRRHSDFYDPPQSHWKHQTYNIASDVEINQSFFYLDLALEQFHDVLPHSKNLWVRDSLKHHVGTAFHQEFSEHSLLTLRYDLNQTAASGQTAQQTERMAQDHKVKAIYTQQLNPDFLLHSRYAFELLQQDVRRSIAQNPYSLLAEPYVRAINQLDIGMDYFGLPKTNAQLELQFRNVNRNHLPDLNPQFLNPSQSSGFANEGQAGLSLITRWIPHMRLSAQYWLTLTDAAKWPWFYTMNYLGIQNWLKFQWQYDPLSAIPWGVHTRYEWRHRANSNVSADMNLGTHTVGLTAWLNPVEPVSLTYDGNFFFNTPSAGLAKRETGTLSPAFFTTDYLSNTINFSYQIHQNWAVGMNYDLLNTWNGVVLQDQRLGTFIHYYLTSHAQIGFQVGWEWYQDKSVENNVDTVNALYFDATMRYYF